MHKILLLLFVLVGFQASSQIDEIRRITKQLCSPEFHGRGYVHKGDSLAADYLVEEFQKLGLEPFKNDYLQHFTIEGVNRFPRQMSVKQDGLELKPGIDFIVDSESGGGTMNLKAVIVEGEKLIRIDGDNVLNQEYFQKSVEQVGKDGYNAMLFDFGGLSSDSIRLLAGLSSVISEMMPVIEVKNQKFTYSVGRKQLAHPLIYIQDSAYNGTENFAIAIDAEFVPEYASQNVMAYIPAKKKCKETIMFTAHYDHLGRMGEDTYFPGGNDNASGTAMLLTMAKYFKENPSDYNILFVAFAGEEAGLLGSKHFVENTPIKLKKVRFLLNLDIMGSGEEGITAVNATLFPEEYELMVSINEELGLLEKVKKRGPTQNSDHYWFTEKGVPAFFIYTMGPNKNYHDVFDTYENLSFEEYEDITKLLVTFVDRLK